MAMQRNSIGLAVIGSGRIGTLRARLAAEHPAVKFIATADLKPGNAKVLADKVGAQVHSGNNLDIINHPDVTAVVVSTAEGEHTEAVLAAIAAGTYIRVLDAKKPRELPRSIIRKLDRLGAQELPVTVQGDAALGIPLAPGHDAHHEGFP